MFSSKVSKQATRRLERALFWCLFVQYAVLVSKYFCLPLSLAANGHMVVICKRNRETNAIHVIVPLAVGEHTSSNRKRN